LHEGQTRKKSIKRLGIDEPKTAENKFKVIMTVKSEKPHFVQLSTDYLFNKYSLKEYLSPKKSDDIEFVNSRKE
jgi:hypothetical protein